MFTINIKGKANPKDRKGSNLKGSFSKPVMPV